MKAGWVARSLKGSGSPRKLLQGLAGSALLAIASQVSAATLTFDFENVPAGDHRSNLLYQGFRFSPNCHYDLLGPGGTLRGYQESSWMGFDGSACYQEDGYNRSFLGPEIYRVGTTPGGGPPLMPVLFIDFQGKPFDLQSIWFNTPYLELLTSNLGYFAHRFPLPNPNLPVDFSLRGREFQDLQWILLRNPGDAGAPFGFDNLVVRVDANDLPEPGSAGLACTALGLLLAAGARRRLKSRVSG
jgi:hypothetical protein